MNQHTWGTHHAVLARRGAGLLVLFWMLLIGGHHTPATHAQDDDSTIRYQEITAYGNATYLLTDLQADDILYLDVSPSFEGVTLALAPERVPTHRGLQILDEAMPQRIGDTFSAYWELYGPDTLETVIRETGTYRLWVITSGQTSMVVSTNAPAFEDFYSITSYAESYPDAIAVYEAGEDDDGLYGFIEDGLVPGDVDYYVLRDLLAQDLLKLHMASDFFDGFQWELMQTRVNLDDLEAYQAAERVYFDNLTDEQRAAMDAIYTEYGDDYEGAAVAIQAYHESQGLPPNPATTVQPYFRQSGYTGNGADFIIPEDGDYILMVWALPTLKTLLPYSFTAAINPRSFSGIAGADPNDAILSREVTVVTRETFEGYLPATSGVVSFTLEPIVYGEFVAIDFEILSDAAVGTPQIAFISEYLFSNFVYTDPSNPNHASVYLYTNADVTDGELRLSVPYTDGVAYDDLRYRLHISVEAQAAPDANAGFVIGATPDGADVVDISHRRKVIAPPTVIDTGLEILQFTNVDQKSETFSVVGILRTQWIDPTLARDTELALELANIYTGLQVNGFINTAAAKGITIPEFTFYNQVSGREIQSRILTVQYDGVVSYEERFSVRLRAAEFEFRTIPFDTQQFDILVETIYPEQQFALRSVARFNRGLAANQGEEEWAFSVAGTSNHPRENFSQFQFAISAERRINFYIFRIFVPLLIIVSIGWATFFIHSYDSRITVASGNLLLFIAFNFTIGGELPRLGYLTFLDTLLLACFVITAAVFALNIYLKRMEDKLDKAQKHRMDTALVIGYPVVFGVSVVLLGVVFGVA